MLKRTILVLAVIVVPYANHAQAGAFTTPGAVRKTETPATSATPQQWRGKRFDEITVVTKSGGHCEHASLGVSAKGISTTGCHEADFELEWPAVENVCYAFGFRGTLVVRTGGKERRVTTTTPAEMKAIRDAVRARSPRTPEIDGCR